MNLPSKIKYAREKMGWTQRKLADESGVNVVRLWNCEMMAEELRMSELTRIANALRRPIDWFLNDDEPDDEFFLHCRESDNG